VVNKKIKWLVYTVLVGLIPILCRLLVWGVSTSDAIQWIAASDLIAFGLVLHISNINEIEHISIEDKSWKTVQNGLSIIFIAAYFVLFTLNTFSEGTSDAINVTTIKVCTFILAAISFAISYSVFDRLSALQPTGKQS
jgi:hypothetical protein